MGRTAPELVITGARVLSTYTERIHAERELWITQGRIAAVKPAGTFRRGALPGKTTVYDARGGIVAPGLIDPHVHIESSMMTACAFAEAALRNGTTTVFCDSHEIGNVCEALALRGVRVIVAGLDMDYTGKPFGQMPNLLAIADYITKLHAICVICGSIANISYRKTAQDGQVVLGEKDIYEPRCRTCNHLTQ
jgi:cytosine/adenosine deaminase-related metal-dependent hydrolase